jgi:hypothetical protein
MAAPTLVIGVGGTGVRVLLRIKERFLEAYDTVPTNVTLFELDTDDYRSTREEFNGVQLLCVGDRPEGQPIGHAEAEFYHVATNNVNDTLDTVFDRKGVEWQWLNRKRMDRTLTKPEDRVIKVGARTVRPVGRSALFLDYMNVYREIESRLRSVVDARQAIIGKTLESGQESDQVVRDDKKAAVFVVASAAGGSGAGMAIDILRMIEDMRNKDDLRAQAISVIALLVGGSAFTDKRGERIDSNTFALLRELDRLTAVAGRPLNRAVPPVMFAPSPVGRFSSRLGPADMILLFDKPDRNGQTRRVGPRSGDKYLQYVISPTLADIVLAFADEKIAPAIRTVRADMGDKWNRLDPFNLLRDGRTPMPGHFPYASAGLHTMIFPERDVRKSAGMRFLLDIWDNFLVSPVEFDAAELSVTGNLWGRKESTTVTPGIFVDKGFSDPTVCQPGVANNQFISMIVTSASASNPKLQLSKDRKFLGVVGGTSTILRVLRLIGVPNQRATANVDYDRLASRLEDRVDKSIDDLDRCNNPSQVRLWRETYLGAGTLGNERDGEWDSWFKTAESVQGHEDNFNEVIQLVIEAILNDTDGAKRKLPYRIDYAEQVLTRLERHVLRITQGDPDRDGSISLLSAYFAKELSKEETARTKVQRLEAQASDKFGEYVAANKAYAKARKELMGMRLIESLSDALLSALRQTRKQLEDWQGYLRQVRRLLGEAQMTHETNRLDKSQIPVRTYLCERPAEGYYFQGTFEADLYARHQTAAWDGFRESVRWSWVNGSLDLGVPFGRQPSTKLTTDDLMHRATTWACTKKGNSDRKDVSPPFRDLAGPEEAKMSVLMYEFFDGHVQTVVSKLTSDPNLASLCPLANWPRSRLQYTLGLPRKAEHRDNVTEFFSSLKKAIQENVDQMYDQRAILLDDPENPRHAVAAEFAVGFTLNHRRDYAEYEATYRNHTNSWFALHCMPEEDQASTRYELAFKRTSELYRDLRLTPFVLDPAVVDVLGDRSRLELFVNALVAGVIGLLPPTRQKQEGVDFYLWPGQSKANRIRLSKMHEPEEISTIAAELAPLADQLETVVRDSRAMNRLRLMYALRTFVLLEHDVDDDKHHIVYEDVKSEIENARQATDLDKRIELYGEWKDRFLGFYGDHKNSYTALAHLGLVLAQVAYELKVADEGKDIGEEY